MGTKVIYFAVSGRPEQAEFRYDAASDEVKDCFRCAAEAGPYDILKLYNYRGNLVNISPSLSENSPTTRYKLEVVAAHCGHCGKDLHGVDIEDVDNRIQRLEKRVFVDEGCFPSELVQLKERVDLFKTKLENVEHLSWLGLFKDMSIGPSALPYNSADQKNCLKRADGEYNEVLKSYLKMGAGLPSVDTLDSLRQPAFDNWQWEDAEMMFLIQQMFIDLGLVQTFHIEMSTLQQFIFEVYKHYNMVPFHNFRHCFCVTQMMYGMICLSRVNEIIEPHEVLIMLVSAFCHDLDHPGYNNVYQINARTELAIRYNDISPLENHHAAVAFDILSQSRCNIFSNMKPDLYKKIRSGIIRLILATDMARHNELLKEFKIIMEGGFDWKSKDHRDSMMKTFIKAADVSNETRPMDVAEPWLECLLQEFFNQSDLEKLEGLPTAPFMDREKVTKSSAQTEFIKFVLIPLYEALSGLFPVFEEFLLKPIQNAFDYYVQMGEKMGQEKLQKKEKLQKNYNAEVERELDIEINRKLSREFDKRLTAEILKKFSEDRERKISGDLRNTGGAHNSNTASGQNSRKTSVYHTPPQFHSPPTSNAPSPLPLHIENEEKIVNNSANITDDEKRKYNKAPFISLNEKKIENNKLYKSSNHQEPKPILNGTTNT